MLTRARRPHTPPFWLTGSAFHHAWYVVLRMYVQYPYLVCGLWCKGSLVRRWGESMDLKIQVLGRENAWPPWRKTLERQQKQKKTRIGYFGDSMIEGDLITQDFRSTLQDTFGGIGVGFMPVTSIVAGFSCLIHSNRDQTLAQGARRLDWKVNGNWVGFGAGNLRSFLTLSRV